MSLLTFVLINSKLQVLVGIRCTCHDCAQIHHDLVPAEHNLHVSSYWPEQQSNEVTSVRLPLHADSINTNWRREAPVLNAEVYRLRLATRWLLTNASCTLACCDIRPVPLFFIQHNKAHSLLHCGVSAEIWADPTENTFSCSRFVAGSRNRCCWTHRKHRFEQFYYC
jgi:hypothetical protein